MNIQANIDPFGLDGVQITEANRDKWLDDRQVRIGASEAAVAIGLPGFQSMLSLYLQKTGEIPRDRIEAGFDKRSRERMAWGLRHEPSIADAYREETGCEWAFSQVYRISRTHPFMCCTIDRMTTDGRIVEFKTTGSEEAGRWGEPGTDMIPHIYLVQVLHQMHVCESRFCDVAVLIGGNDFRIYTVTRDGNETLISRIIEMEERFMDCVRRRIPPAIDPEKDAGLLAYLFPVEEGTIDFGDTETDMWLRYKAMSEERLNLKKEMDEIKVRIAQKMGLAGAAKLANGKLLIRKIINIEERVQTVSGYTYVKFYDKALPRR